MFPSTTRLSLLLAPAPAHPLPVCPPAGKMGFGVSFVQDFTVGCTKTILQWWFQIFCWRRKHWCCPHVAERLGLICRLGVSIKLCVCTHICVYIYIYICFFVSSKRKYANNTTYSSIFCLSLGPLVKRGMTFERNLWSITMVTYTYIRNDANKHSSNINVEINK